MMNQQNNANEIPIFSIAFTDNVYKGEFEAISKIDANRYILIPTSLKEMPLIYNFESKNVDQIKVTKSNNLVINLTKHRITDATDIDQDSNLWLLGLKTKPDNKIQSYLLKAHYCPESKEIILIDRYKVPRSPEQGNEIEFNYAGLVQVSQNDFILCANRIDRPIPDNPSDDLDMINKITGSSLVRIDPADPQNIKVFPLLLSPSMPLNLLMYNMYQFSSAFNTETGICIMSRVPDSYFSLACMITTKEINKIREIVDGYADSKINVPLVLESDMNPNTSYDSSFYYSPRDPNSDLFFMKIIGIEAMTMTSCVNDYRGISSWIYPYLYTDGEVIPGPGDEKYAYLIDGPIPANYDKTKVGRYIQPVVGTIKYLST
jgi:hypothetical protein